MAEEYADNKSLARARAHDTQKMWTGLMEE